MQVPRVTLSRILAELIAYNAKSVLDVGCGPGELVSALDARGFIPVGIDHDSDVLARARARYPGLRFEEAAAQALPFADASFDAAVFLHTLHHVEPAVMDAALGEAMRCLRRGGVLIVVEPIAEGPFLEVMRPVDDETGARLAAQAALERLAATMRPTGTLQLGYDRQTAFAGVERFVDYLLEVDPARAPRAADARPALAQLLERHSTRTSEGLVLTQPLDFRVFIRQ